MVDFSQQFLDQLRLKQKPSEKDASKNDPKPEITSSETSSSSVPTVDQHMPHPQNGIQKIKDSSGHILQKIPYENGKISGTREIYSSHTYKLVQTLTYQGGILEGTVTAFDDDQQVIQEMPYHKGKITGMAHFYAKGSKLADIHYDDNQMSGPAVYYGPGEYVAIKSFHKHGKLEGEYTLYDDKQNVLRKCLYKHGKLNGKSQIFYPSGKILEDAFYQDNIPQETIIQYYETGVVKKITFYNTSGKITMEETYTEAGDLKEKKEVSPVAI